MTVATRIRRAVRGLLGADPSAREATPAPGEAKAAAREQRRAIDEQKRQIRLERLQRQKARRTELSAHGDGAVTVPLDYARHEIRLLVTSEMEREWRAHACAKEPWTVEWLEASLGEGGVLYDIGANVGAFSMIAAKICGSRGAVVAFEPGYGSFAHLCDNIVLNRLHEVVIPVPFALGRTTGLGTFTYKTLHPGQSRHRFREGTWARKGASESERYHQPVFVMPLDELVRQYRLPPPNHIKLDVDGAELAVLGGAVRTLQAPELQSLLVEIDDTLSEPVVAFLGDHGFALERKHKRVHTEQTQVWYGVFVRQS